MWNKAITKESADASAHAVVTAKAWRARILTLAAIVMAMGMMLSACGKAEQPPAPAQTVSSRSSVEESVEEVTQEEEPEEEVVEQRTLVISEEGYDELMYFSDEYLVAKEGEEYFFVRYDADGDLEVIGDDLFPEGVVNRFSKVVTDLQDGAVIVSGTYEDGTEYDALLAHDFSLIGATSGMLRVTDYRDGIIVGDNLWDENEEIFHLYVKEGENYYDAYFFKDQYTIVGSSYGMFVEDGSYFNYPEVESYSLYRDAGATIQSIIDGAGTEDAEPHGLRYGDYVIGLDYNLPNKEGWISAYCHEVIENEDGSITRTYISSGYFNIKTGEYTEKPEDISSCMYFTEDNGCNLCTVIGDRAVLIVEPAGDGYVRQIFDLHTGAYASDETYLHISLGYWDLLLVQNMDGEWGYIRNDDLTETGEWFDDASVFCNGYAIVNRDGEAWLVDEQLRQVSEPFAAESAYAPYDYLTFSDLNGRAVFFAKIDGKYHLVQVQ